MLSRTLDIVTIEPRRGHPSGSFRTALFDGASRVLRGDPACVFTVEDGKD